MTNKPPKPSAPIGFANFGKDDSVSIIKESLPADKDELELVVADKFIEALNSRFGRVLNPLEHGDEWPDFWTAEGNTRIALEVVEVIDPEYVKSGLAHKQPRWVPVDYPATLLAKTVESKVKKRYPKLTDAKLWLLAYENSGALAGDLAKAAEVANTYCKSIAGGGFDEIWVAWPMAEDVPAFVESVWPNTQYSSTARKA